MRCCLASLQLDICGLNHHAPVIGSSDGASLETAATPPSYPTPPCLHPASPHYMSVLQQGAESAAEAEAAVAALNAREMASLDASAPSSDEGSDSGDEANGHVRCLLFRFFHMPYAGPSSQVVPVVGLPCTCCSEAAWLPRVGMVHGDSALASLSVSRACLSSHLGWAPSLPASLSTSASALSHTGASRCCGSAVVWRSSNG